MTNEQVEMRELSRALVERVVTEEKLRREIEDLSARVRFLEDGTEAIYSRGVKEGVAYAALSLSIAENDDGAEHMNQISNEFDRAGDISIRFMANKINAKLEELTGGNVEGDEAGASLTIAPIEKLKPTVDEIL